MRLATQDQQNEAASEGMKGFLIGGLKWGLIGATVVGIAHAFGPIWFRRQRIQPKVCDHFLFSNLLFLFAVIPDLTLSHPILANPQFYIVMAAALGGGGYNSDKYFTLYERRGRAGMVEASEKERLKILYGKPKSSEQASV